MPRTDRGARLNLRTSICALSVTTFTSTYFEGEEKPRDLFPSKAFGYSRDHRGDRPQIVIGLLVTSDGVPIAHHVFSGNTADRSTLAQVMADLQARFGVGRIALVADRGLISEENLALVAANGFDHVLATRLHRDPTVAAVLEAAASKQAVLRARRRRRDQRDRGRLFLTPLCRGRLSPPPRARRRPGVRLLAATEDGEIALSRVRKGRLVDPAKIGAAADRILRDSGVRRCFSRPRSPTGCSPGTTTRRPWTTRRRPSAGRYVITTSLDNKTASTAQVVAHYWGPQSVERRFAC